MASPANFGDLPPDGFVRQAQLLKIVPFSSATLWRAIKAGRFPTPIKLSERCTAWKVASIREWMAARTTAQVD